MRIIRGKRFESSVEEAVILSIHIDCNTHRQTDYYLHLHARVNINEIGQIDLGNQLSSRDMMEFSQNLNYAEHSIPVFISFLH